MKTEKSLPYKNKYVEFLKYRPLKWLLRKPIAGILVHWTFQGLLYMDFTERSFKITTDIVLTLLLFLVLRVKFQEPYAMIIAFVLSHTSNFLFNGQLWVLLKHYGLVHNSSENFEQYLKAFTKRVNEEKSIAYAAVFGSRTRNKWRPTSDLDVRLIKHNGLYNGIKACIFVVKERTRALLSCFPLDIFILDSYEKLNSLPKDEIPLELKTNNSK